MFIIIIGFKAFNTNAKPHILYSGTCGDEAEKAVYEAAREAAAAGEPFVTAQKLVHPRGIPMQLPEFPTSVATAPDSAAGAQDQDPAESEEPIYSDRVPGADLPVASEQPPTQSAPKPRRERKNKASSKPTE
jgi:hypothetical protein